MKKIILFILGGLVLLILLAAFYFSLFSSVNISEKNTGGEILVYQERVGSYQQSGPALAKIFSDLKNNFGINCQIGLGIFYDNPQRVAAEKLRSDLACVLPGGDAGKLEKLQSSPSFKVKRNPVIKNVVARFPYRNPLSYVLGVIKVYPKISNYLVKHNYQPAPAVEVYNPQGGYIEYRMAVVEK